MVVLEYLDWLAAHKRMESDLDRMIVLKRDYAESLAEFPEYALALGVVGFIETVKEKWWPSLDDLKNAVLDHVVMETQRHAPTNASVLTRERFGRVVSDFWMSSTLIHERTLYACDRAVYAWVRANYFDLMRDLVDDFKLIEVKK